MRSRLFRARELVGFAALAGRRLFQGHFDYCNFDTYAFIIQHYDPGNPGAFSFSTRRRDSVTQHLRNADEFAFMKPLHVASHAQMRFDSGFLAGLLKADEGGALPYEAIVELNRANTDSPDVPSHTEVVLTKSAFEYLFGIGQSAPEFVDTLWHVIPERKADDMPKGPLESRWKEARPKAMRPIGREQLTPIRPAPPANPQRVSPDGTSDNSSFGPYRPLGAAKATAHSGNGHIIDAIFPPA
jgi:hypothetical protein